MAGSYAHRLFRPDDPMDIRLWPGAAPGAAGTDACRDIPVLLVYNAAGAGRVRPASDVAAESGDRATAFLIVTGGGYDRLTSPKEQAQVAQYISRQLNVTAFVLYYRLVQPDGTYRYPAPMQAKSNALWPVPCGRLAINPHCMGMLGFSAAVTLRLQRTASKERLWVAGARCGRRRGLLAGHACAWLRGDLVGAAEAEEKRSQSPSVWLQGASTSDSSQAKTM